MSGPASGQSGQAVPPRARGRARDPGIDRRVLAAAARQLATLGFEAMSVAAVAHEAGTTRQAIYRRWPTKSALAADALITATETPPDRSRRAGATGASNETPFAALVAELANFQRGVSGPGRLSLVGTMLQDTTAPDVRARYRTDVVAPRRARIRAILETARDDGWIDADADLTVAVTLCTGSWYARALAQDDPPPRWAARTAVLVWRAVGGSFTDPAA